jgi:hypothetical protein
MRSIFLIGGMLGFVITAVTSWQADHAPDRVLLDAAFGCLAGALLARWLWSIVLRGLRETILKRQEAIVADSAVKPKA